MTSITTVGNELLLETKVDKTNPTDHHTNSILTSGEDANIVLFHIQKLGQSPHSSSILILNKNDLSQKSPEQQFSKLQAQILSSTSQDRTSSHVNKLQADSNSSLQVANKQNNKIEVSNEKSGTEEKVYVCDVEGCGRTFHNLGYIKYHKAVHYGGKDLKCNYKGCGRMFIWPAHFKYHLLTHTGERMYKCNYDGCNSSFYTLQRLAVHVRTHTGERPFTCSETGCNKGFTTAGNLKNHMRLHTGARPFLCPVEGCGRCFTEHSSLRKHNLVHTGEKPYVCDICGKSFSQSGSRNQHRKHHQLSNIKKVKIYKECGSQTETTDVEKSPDRLLIFQQDDEMLQMQDSSNESESVSFSNGISSEHVMTVGNHEQENMDCIMETEEILGCEETVVTDSLITHSNASVVVLAQPQDLVSMATNYHVPPHVQEEIVYKNDLIISDLEQEETSGLESHVKSEENANTIICSGTTDKNIVTLFNQMNKNEKNERNTNETSGLALLQNVKYIL